MSDDVPDSKRMKHEREGRDTTGPIQLRAGTVADQFDAHWYEADEQGATDDVDPLAFGATAVEVAHYAKREVAVTRDLGSRYAVATQRMQSQSEDARLWGEDRLRASGVTRGSTHDTNVVTEEDFAAVVTARQDARPPFLQGSTKVSRKQEIVLPVRDVTCDFAMNAKAGSDTLRAYRERQDRIRQTQELNGTAPVVKGPVVSKDEADLKALRVRLRHATGPEQEALKSDVEKLERQVIKSESTFADKIKDESWSGATDFSRLNTIAQQRALLPVATVREDFLRYVAENQVIIARGETGSGKTTQLTQYLYEAGFAAHGIIGCTQPRRAAAMSVAKRVAEESGLPLGDLVGYAIRFEDCTSEKTRIKYMTDGVLRRETVHDRDLNKYSVVIMDEAHERSLDTDVLFGVIKKVLAVRSDFRLIVTSATMDTDKFSRFFGHAPVFQIPGRVFRIEMIHTSSPVTDYVEQAVRIAMEIHVKKGPGDILIFMTGQEDVSCVAALLEERLTQYGRHHADTLTIIPIYSMLTSEQQKRMFQRVAEGQRKCVVSTNLAETSLTLDGIKYVVDSGYCKIKMYNPRLGLDTLQVYPISQAQARQRAGRAGRTSEGFCYRLYSEYQVNHEMLPLSVPEIQRTNLAAVVLLLKSLGVKNLLKFDFLDAPSEENLLHSETQLWMLGALDDDGNLTPTGRTMVELPVDPVLGKFLDVAQGLGCAEEALSIVAIITVDHRKVHVPPRFNEERAMAAKDKFFVCTSDHLTLLNVYNSYRTHIGDAFWLADNFINVTLMKQADQVRLQLREIMIKLKMRLSSCGSDTDLVRRALARSHYVNAARRNGMTEYISILQRSLPSRLHPSSALFVGGSMPDYVVYHEVINTGTKEYMGVVTAIDPEWAVEQCPHLMAIRYRNQTRPTTTTGALVYEAPASLAPPEPSNARKAQPGRVVEATAAKGPEVLTDFKSGKKTTTAPGQRGRKNPF